MIEVSFYLESELNKDWIAKKFEDHTGKRRDCSQKRKKKSEISPFQLDCAELESPLPTKSSKVRNVQRTER